MSRKGRWKGPSPPAGNTIGADRSPLIEQGIDAVDLLRVEMRRLGMTACADALDDAFAHCLRDYMTLKANDPTKSNGQG
jgi:3-deoxy-D-arabino-heptulosonate 7-phosphate (DAHP) synthase